jgi:hypothetical protein
LMCPTCITLMRNSLEALLVLFFYHILRLVGLELVHSRIDYRREWQSQSLKHQHNAYL